MCQDFVDDDEHGGGQFLLNILMDSCIQNRVILVVRNYDGEHIGNKRFDLMRDAVRSALDRAQKNAITGKHDCVWTFENERGNDSIRGRGGRNQCGQQGRGCANNRALSLMQGVIPDFSLAEQQATYAEKAGMGLVVDMGQRPQNEDNEWIEQAHASVLIK